MEMDAFNLVADSNTMNIDSSYCNDRSLFGSLQDPGLKRKILRIKSNGPEVTSLELSRGDDLNERASMRLGCILGQDTHVKELTILCSLDVIGLCAGLQSNQCIQSLTLIGINLHHNAKLSALAPFVRNNPSLKCMTLHSGNIGSAGINILSAALLDRSEDTLEYLSLSNNHFGDINLDQLVLALNRNRNLSFLSLCGTGIGPRGCTSLAKLLSNRESNLRDLELDFNSIDNKSTIVLADSLRKNTKLEELELGGNNAITSEGWTAMLKLVCNSSKIDAIMQSNHTLCSIGYLSADLETRIYHSLGTDDANLLHASLKLNKERNKISVVRLKTLWSHARGDLNLGDSSIVTGAMPCILAWIGVGSNEPNANLIRHHETPLPKVELDAIKLDSVYRILRSKPDLILNGCPTERAQSKRRVGEMEDLRNENKDLRDVNKELRGVNKELRDDNKRLKTMLQAMSDTTSNK